MKFRRCLAVLGLAIATAVPLSIPAGAEPAKTAPVIQKVELSFGVDGKVTRSVDGVEQASTSRLVPPATKAAALTAGYFNGYRFASRFICQQNNIGLNWNISYAGDQFENAGVTTAVLAYRYVNFTDPTQKYCSYSYSVGQIVTYGTYSSPDGACMKTGGNAYNNGNWYSDVSVSFNLWYTAGCRDTAQNKNHYASQGTGYSIGLNNFNNATDASVMNDHFQYNWAGGFDRTNVWQIYS